MSKRPKEASAFRMPVDDAEAAPPPRAAPAPTPATPAAATAYERPVYREGKKNLSVWIPDKAHRQLKAMCAEEGMSVQDYMTVMLNREFARKNRPEIA